VIPDEMSAIKAAIFVAMQRAHVVTVTGGLGPTPDDLTRDAIAQLYEFPLVEDPELLTHVQALFRARGSEMPESSRNQALFPVGARKIPNPHGTATGIHIEREGSHLFSMPGVPVEMQQMTDEYVVPVVRAAFPRAVALTRTLRLGNIGESILLQRLGDQDAFNHLVSVAYLPHHGLLDVRLTARSHDQHEAEAQITQVEALIREKVGEHVYAVGNSTLASVIGNILVNRGQRVATAESCTGGLVANMITDTPGSSRWFDRGWITYSNEAKHEEVLVPEELISKHGAVSEQVACALAEGARDTAHADWGVACTGIAGPEGGSEEKPVGMVWIAVASKLKTTAWRLQFSGLRETIKLRTAHSALYLLYHRLVEPDA
jgi:nicotinamide-nucleotide amidase